MKLLKKILTATIAVSAVLAVSAYSAYAEDDVVTPSVGSVIGINHDKEDFEDLFCVIDGEVYMPLRLAFPNLNERRKNGSGIGMSLYWDADDSYPVVRMIYGKTTGEDFIYVEGGKTQIPFKGTRKGIEIFFDGDLRNGASALISYIEYDEQSLYDPGYRPYAEECEFNNLVYLKELGSGGDRLFVSMEDIALISDLLQIDNGYSVKIHPTD